MYLRLPILLLFVVGPSFTIQAQQEATSKQQNSTYCQQEIWYDDWYCHFRYGAQATVEELNQWFVNEHDTSTDKPTTSGRLRLGWEPRSGKLNEFDSRFKIRVTLPALEDRVELLFTDEQDDSSEPPVKAARSAQLGNQESATVAIQFSQSESKLAYRLGLGRGQQVYVRSRYLDHYRFNNKTKLRYFGEVHYYSEDQLGFELNAQIAHKIEANKALEVNHSFRFSEQSNDWLWRHELNYVYFRDEKQSYLFSAIVDGFTRPNTQLEQGIVSVRYKRNVLRPWLFLEVEPYALWLRQEDFRTSLGLAMRLEIHFSG